MAEWICIKCGYVYNEMIGDEAHGVKQNTPFEQVDPAWVCPRCGAGKQFFKKKE